MGRESVNPAAFWSLTPIFVGIAIPMENADGNARLLKTPSKKIAETCKRGAACVNNPFSELRDDSDKK